MIRRILPLAALAALCLPAAAGEAFFDAYGTVYSVQSASGPYVGVAVGQTVHLEFKVLTPGTVLTPGQLEQFTVDPASVVLEIASSSFAAGTGSPSVIVQNGSFGGADGVRQFGAPAANGSTVTYDFSASSPNMFTSTDPLQNVGFWTPVWASYDCRIAGGGTYIEWTPTTFEIRLSGVGTSYCFGDGSGAACPCGNSSPVGGGAGCLNSLGTGGRLSATGTASLGADSVILNGAQMPNSSALYFQGTSQQAGGPGVAFGDGLRCAGGTIVRLGTKTNSSGASQYPAVGDPSVSVRGLIGAPGTRTYQVWYRNAAAFCTASTFNLSNGVEIAWTL